MDVVGAFQVFAIANRHFPELERVYEISVASSVARSEITGYDGLSILSHCYYRDITRKVDTLVIAGKLGARSGASPEVVSWITSMSKKVRRLASICTGAFLLAETGLLDRKRATTHWAFAGEFASRFPRVQVDPDPIWIREGRIYTSAGVTAGMDLALALVEEDLGSKAALAVARVLVVSLRRPGGQSQFSRSLAAQASNRKPLRELLVWAVENLSKDLSVENLASRVAMSRRNFTRVFAAELGIPPARYVEQLRVEAARRQLEETSRSVEEIASACRFSNGESMRRAFLRSIGTPPSQYRDRFQCAGVSPVHLPTEARMFRQVFANTA